MQKYSSICLIVVLCIVFFAGCGSDTKQSRKNTDTAIKGINSSLNQSFKTTQYDYQFSEEFDTSDLHYIVYETYDDMEKADNKISFVFKKDSTEFVAVKAESNKKLSQVQHIVETGLGDIDLLNLNVDELQKYYNTYLDSQSDLGNYKMLRLENDTYCIIIYQKDYLSPDTL